MTPKRGVTLRAVLIGLVFIPLNAYLVVQLETVWGIGDPTTMTIFFNAVFCLFLVITLPLAGYYYFNYLWFPFLVCWLVKWVLLKYGGIHGYRRAVPLFLGLVLGDFVLGCIWTILGLLTGEATYMFQELVIFPQNLSVATEYALS